MIDALVAASDAAQPQSSERSEPTTMKDAALAVVDDPPEAVPTEREELAQFAATLIVARNELAIPEFDRKLLREDPEEALRRLDEHETSMAPLITECDA